ncbi:putative ribonuclease H-like domain-containing protein, partial [Tanacetum coccineum]
MHGEVIPQEGINQKFLRSLSQEWTMHTIVWRNKPEIETLSLHYLFNNLKDYESEVKGTSSSTTNSHNVAFRSSSSTNSATRAVNTAQCVNIASTQGAADSSTTVENLSDAVIYSFFASQPNGFEVEHLPTADDEGKKIPEDNWKGSWTMATKKELGCRAPRNQDSRNKEPTRRTVPVEETTLNALVSQCDGFGYDWSDQAEEGPTNFALMAYSSTSSTSSTNSEVNSVKEIKVNTGRPKAVISVVKENKGNAVKASASLVWRPKHKILDHVSRNNGASMSFKRFDYIDAQGRSKKYIFLKIMKKLMEDLLPLEVIPKEGKLLGKKNSVLFTDTECVVLSPDFKLTDESRVLLKVPRKDNMYSVDLKNFVPQGGLTCLFAKATPDESNLWHRRLGHVKFKTMNKLVRGNLRGNLVRGLPLKIFENNHTCVACQKGKQHKASCKTKTVSSISQPLQMLHMDLFGPTFVKSLMKKMYCLVVTDDYSIENLIDLKVKVIRCDNGTEFKNKIMNQFCEMKGRKPALSFMRSFGCPVTILNTIDHLGKFDGKADEGFFIGYSTNSKAFRVFNSRTRIVEENQHVKFSEETPNIARNGPNWLFDIDALTKFMNYELVVAGNQSNGIAGTKACENEGKARMETVHGKDYILLPFLSQDPPFSSSSKDSPDARFKPSGEEGKKDAEHLETKDSEVPNTKELRVNQEQDESVNNTNNINNVSSTVNTASIEDNVVDENIVYGCVDNPNMPHLEEVVYSDDGEDVDAEADMINLDTHILVNPTLTTIIHKDHPLEQIIGDIHSTPQTRRMTKSVTDHVEHKKVIQALTDPSWIEAMQDELLQFKLQKVWTLVDLPYGKMAIGIKWIYKNKKDERGIVVRNKARLQGYTQEEGIDYDEVFAPVARIKTVRLFLAYASFKDFVVYQMDVKSAFLYGKIEDEVYVCQPPGFEDLEFTDRVYKVEKALYGL